MLILTWINRNPLIPRIIKSGKRPRHTVVKHSLAILAVLFLMLRPVCDVWAAGHGNAGPAPGAHAVAHADGMGGDEHAEFCCAEVQDGNLISAGSIAPANAASDGSLFVAAQRGGVARERFGRQGVTPIRDAPLARFSYYARSSRILR